MTPDAPDKVNALRAEHDELAARILKKDRSGYLAKAAQVDIDRYEQIREQLAAAHGEPTDAADAAPASDVPDVAVGESDESQTPPANVTEVADSVQGEPEPGGDLGEQCLIAHLKDLEEDLRTNSRHLRESSLEYRRCLNHYSQAIKSCQQLRQAIALLSNEQQQAERRIAQREIQRN